MVLSPCPKLLFLPLVLLSATPALAQTPVESEASAPLPPLTLKDFSDRWVLDTARTSPAPPDKTRIGVHVHGEYQARYWRQTDLSLTPPPSDPSATSLGQRNVIYHWLRLNPQINFRDKVSIVGQLDVPRGFFGIDSTRYVGSADEPLEETNPVGVSGRWLYAEGRTGYGTWRVGQQPWHVGMGLMANDGNHPSLFGDYFGGDIVERILFATNPAGSDNPLTIVLAGDLVFRDQLADLIDKDQAWQAIFGIIYGSNRNQVGAYGIVREQQTSRESLDVLTPYSDDLSIRQADVFGRFTSPVPGAQAFIFGEAEAVLNVGKSSYARTPELGQRDQAEQIRSYGTAIRVGTTRVATKGDTQWGDLVLALEWGYASGDADPNDGVDRRFTFDPNHNVGLLLFDQVLAWSTARATVNSGDPAIARRPPAGSSFYPSNGGVFGATYLYPTVVVRPRPWLDLKGAMVLAQTTSDVVDPYRFGILGQVASFRGGAASQHNLGMEFDLGVEARAELKHDISVQLGAQGGFLLPGNAFDDEVGNGLPTQAIAMGRLGLQF